VHVYGTDRLRGAISVQEYGGGGGGGGGGGCVTVPCTVCCQSQVFHAWQSYQIFQFNLCLSNTIWQSPNILDRCIGFRPALSHAAPRSLQDGQHSSSSRFVPRCCFCRLLFLCQRVASAWPSWSASGEEEAGLHLREEVSGVSGLGVW